MFRSDWWLPVGISHFISGLFGRKIFGSTEYQYWIMTVSGCGLITKSLLY